MCRTTKRETFYGSIISIYSLYQIFKSAYLSFNQLCKLTSVYVLLTDYLNINQFTFFNKCLFTKYLQTKTRITTTLFPVYLSQVTSVVGPLDKP